MSKREWIIQVDDLQAIEQLRTALNAFEWNAQSVARDIGCTLIVDRFQGLRVEVFAREHPPPHFRVACDRETANYRIRDCVRLNGGLKRHHGVIRGWHARNKPKLIEAWNRLRPTDCPVGEYRE